ncbi:MAG: alpha-hydroxy acid oxidase [Rhodospirillales bacterium]
MKRAFPSILDLQRRAAERVPFFASEYLECGTGAEEALARNRQALSCRGFLPRFLAGSGPPDITTELFGLGYAGPIGMAPVGMAGLIWPGAERKLARLAAEAKIPFCMSTVAAESLEDLGRLAQGYGWFQLYPARRRALRDDLIARAKAAGFTTLALTVDVPTPSIRERQRRAGLTVPPTKDLRFWRQVLRRPAWALATLRRGEPRFRTLERYETAERMRNQSSYFADELAAPLDWSYVAEVRALWDGPFLLKGLLSPDDAAKAVEQGIDGIWVSNHGGRQFDGCPAAIDCLAPIRAAVGDRTKLLFDSGIRSGLDILRALHEGADFVFAGRPFVYGCAADPRHGAARALEVLLEDLENALQQLGCQDLSEIAALTPIRI